MSKHRWLRQLTPGWTHRTTVHAGDAKAAGNISRVHILQRLDAEGTRTTISVARRGNQVLIRSGYVGRRGIDGRDVLKGSRDKVHLEYGRAGHPRRGYRPDSYGTDKLLNLEAERWKHAVVRHDGRIQSLTRETVRHSRALRSNALSMRRLAGQAKGQTRSGTSRATWAQVALSAQRLQADLQQQSMFLDRLRDTNRAVGKSLKGMRRVGRIEAALDRSARSTLAAAVQAERAASAALVAAELATKDAAAIAEEASKAAAKAIEDSAKVAAMTAEKVGVAALRAAERTARAAAQAAEVLARRALAAVELAMRQTIIAAELAARAALKTAEAALAAVAAAASGGR